ncbi:MAG TPA: leucine--tRNA ligase [Clostridia bacterium]|nr:leucine--tRNA ligase [Clostridia bacterium]
MSREYNPGQIEPKWQKLWEEKNAFKAENSADKPKYYCLIEFPYPSGQGLHVGHTRPYTGLDIIARKRRMQGYNVLYPIGWDAFGLPTENYALKTGIHPAEVTRRNVELFKNQCKKIGYSFDWSREINTTDPGYYKWTQWIFLKLFEKGLAYKAEMPVNWCTECKVGLANEEVVDGVCERCGGEVVRKVKSQWMLKITEYADKLLEGLDDVDFIEMVKTQQRNWIGRSQGVELDFAIAGTNMSLRVYTTRADTLFGATYMVISPEHPIINQLQIENIDEVIEYREKAARKSDFERTELANREKTGVRLMGVNAVNPVNGSEIPIYISDYVLMTYGTGAIMAVPAHDSRDWEFARKFNLPIIQVVDAGEADVENAPFTDVDKGTMINSGFLNGLSVEDAIKKMTEYLEENNLGKRKTNYKLRDWVFSRQRYWGEPIPLVWCDSCGWVAIPENELPLVLPEVDDFHPTAEGESPLAKAYDWVNTKCPKCGGPAKRETDTMPQWAGSSWYFLRYIDPKNDTAFASHEAMDYWMNVDWYNGGMEHTTLHLLYSRFWHRFLYDCGYVNTPEPYARRTSHGMILGENNEKMSKSRGNVINPDDIVKEFGADTLRTYIMFIGTFDQSASWSSQGVRGCRRFLERVYNLSEIVTDDIAPTPALEKSVHRAIKKVSDDFERMKFNTAIAAMMTLTNDFYAAGKISKGDIRSLLLILNPVAPHLCEEMWSMLGFDGFVFEQRWPEWDESKLIEETVELAVQVNGRLRSKIVVDVALSDDQIIKVAKEDERVAPHIQGKEIKKAIVIKNRLVNIVV